MNRMLVRVGLLGLIAAAVLPSVAAASTGTDSRRYVAARFQDTSCGAINNLVSGSTCFDLDGTERRIHVIFDDRSGRRVYFGVTFRIAGASYPEGFNACNEAGQTIPAGALDVTLSIVGPTRDCPGIATRGVATVELTGERWET